MSPRVTFPNKLLPYLLVAPQLAITLVFFYWPAIQAVYQSMLREDPFGLQTQFVWFRNFERVLSEPNYINSMQVTAIFSVATAFISMGVALVLAVMADRVIRGRGIYRTLMIWPYAVAPAIAGMLWLFMFNPSMGTFAYMLRSTGYNWDPLLNGGQAMTLLVAAAAWKQISYNFLFFVAGLQAIPHSLIEAAAIDGARPTKRFWTIVFPLLSPTTFFLLIVNINYAMFDTFGLIDATTNGGPNQATNILVYKVYADGFLGLNIGSSSAQSVVLMIIVIALTAIQFRYVERRVQY